MFILTACAYMWGVMQLPNDNEDKDGFKRFNIGCFFIGYLCMVLCLLIKPNFPVCIISMFSAMVSVLLSKHRNSIIGIVSNIALFLFSFLMMYTCK